MEARSVTPSVLIAAGGTGGHLFPAAALAQALAGRGIAVDLATDERVGGYGDFPSRATHVVPSATFPDRNPITVARSGFKLARGLMASLALLSRLHPAAVVGFGGYPTLPPMLAARLRRIPTIIHEQNAVLGRANRLLAPLVSAIGTGFPGVLNRQLAGKTTHTGNPVRPAVIAAAATPYPDLTGHVRLLVFGGSQGARIMADIVPEAIERLPGATRSCFAVTQQARAEDLERVRGAYRRIGVAASVEPFFRDLPHHMAQSHLVVARSGASTVAELAAIGRPAILVPLPHALDQDQRANAALLEKAGGAIMIEQRHFSPDCLAGEIAALAAAPARLAAMAAASHAQGRPDAADRLADLVLRVAGL
jgi:UDP-N-acetylglucosamine--N-acetylmuramyl-(pentapeptide) pyrophosphoryl-undecaprenol N-acetylglucosamine transferase